mmetsp:Transcript_20125/g.33773  ORF Transcript_20125/g.33773 Transcript_20125/m.33773 type:complete len:104 (-) Transcript_20125:360-671(-)
MPAAYQPKVEGELDTQNFESFDEDVNMEHPRSNNSSLAWKHKDLDFLGYTYKNFEVLDSVHTSGEKEVRKKEGKKKPSLSTVFGESMNLGAAPRTGLSGMQHE